MFSKSNEYHYVVYIDEAGDPGLSRVQPIDAIGSTEWFIIGAVLIRAENENKPVEWIQDFKKRTKLTQKPDLHYNELRPDKKLDICEFISQKPLRGFAILSNKKNMRKHNNPNAEKKQSPHWFYNYCVRLVLERITDYCQKRAIKDNILNPKIKIIFSERKDLNYGQTKAYFELIKLQSRSNNLYLNKRDVKWELLEHNLVEVIPHNKNAGLQLADCVASAFYQAANSTGNKNWDIRPALLLEKIMPKENNSYKDYGVALQPTPPQKARLDENQKIIFKRFGYEF